MAAHLSSRCPSLLLAVLLLSVVSARTGAVDDEFICDGFSGNDLTMYGEASVGDGVLQLTSHKSRRPRGLLLLYNLCLGHHRGLPWLECPWSCLGALFQRGIF
jgi:hypothetical protein